MSLLINKTLALNGQKTLSISHNTSQKKNNNNKKLY